MIDLYKLMASENVVRAYTYRGRDSEECWFDGTPDNIASFIIKNQDADRIVLTDPLDRLVLNTYGSMIDSCPDRERMMRIAQKLIPMQMDELEPAVVPLYSREEMDYGYPNTEAVVGIFRHGEDDYSLWDVSLPQSIVAQVKAEAQIIRPDLEALLKEIPEEGALPEDRLYLVERTGESQSLFYAKVGADFLDEFSHLGVSVRGNLSDILEEIQAPETEISIMWDDLKSETQDRIKKMLGDNGNYDTFPIATIYAPEQEQGMKME